MKQQKTPVALTIAGSDSGGQAGIQADLKTFLALGVHGTTVITAITAQSPTAIRRIQPVAPRMVEEQLLAIFSELEPAAAKTGMLFSRTIVEVVAEFFQGRRIPLVLDPVIVSTSGTRLLAASAIALLKQKLFPLAAVLTPNLQEAEVLTGRTVRTESEMISAARFLYERHGAPVLVKGGHLGNRRKAVDVLFDGRKPRTFARPFLSGRILHGAGCTYSAAITASLARGNSLERSIDLAKDYIFRAIEGMERITGGQVLRHLPKGLSAKKIPPHPGPLPRGKGD